MLTALQLSLSQFEELLRTVVWSFCAMNCVPYHKKSSLFEDSGRGIAVVSVMVSLSTGTSISRVTQGTYPPVAVYCDFIFPRDGDRARERNGCDSQSYRGSDPGSDLCAAWCGCQRARRCDPSLSRYHGGRFEAACYWNDCNRT